MSLYAALLLAAAALAMPLRISPPATAQSTFFESFRDGWKLVVGGVGRPLLQLAAVDAIEGFFVSATAILIALIATVESRGLDSRLCDPVHGVRGRRRASRVLRSDRGTLGNGLDSCSAFRCSRPGPRSSLAVTLPPTLLLAAAAWFVVGVATTMYTRGKFVFFRGSVAPEQIGRLFSNMYLFPGISGSIGALVISDIALGGNPTRLGIEVGVGFLVAGVLALALPGVDG